MRRTPTSDLGGWCSRDIISSVTAAGNVILLHIRSGTYFGLDGSAARIVELLNESPDVEAAATALAEEYGIPFERALIDTNAVVDAVNELSATRTSRGRRPTVAGIRMMTQWWWHQQWPYRVATFEVVIVVIVVELGLRIADISRLARWMRVPLATDEASPPSIRPDDLAGLTSHEQRVHWAVHWIMEHWLYDGTCLRRALVFGWFLRRRKPVIRLGMLDDQEAVAHAWLEVEGRTFNQQVIAGTFSSGTPGGNADTSAAVTMVP